MENIHWRVAATAGLLLGLAAGVVYRLSASEPDGADRPTAPATGDLAASAVSLGLAAASQPLPPVPAASASAAALPAADAFAALSPRARRMAADWCGYGAREALKEEEAREARKKDGHASGDDESPSDGEQVINIARSERLQAWIRTLRGRSDLRSQAMGDFLAGDTPSRAHLQDLARRSTDPMVTALALARPCKSEGCRMVDAAQWARLEPDNLMAWMAQLQDSKLPAEQVNYLLERMARESRRADDYTLALTQAIAGLAQARTPGLQQMAEGDLLGNQMAAIPIPSVRPLIEACKPGRNPAPPAGACQHVAALMWQMPHLLHRTLALALARTSVPPGDPLRAEWEQRSEQYEAYSEALQDANLKDLEQVLGSMSQDLCSAGSRLHEGFARLMTTGEWELAEHALAAASEPVSALVQRARAKRNGRSMMDGPQPAASAASR